MNKFLLILGLVCNLIGVIVSMGLVYGGDSQSIVNITELDTLDRMRYTTIQMTIIDLQNTANVTMTNDEIASAIFEYQQSNESINRLTTMEIEELYRNITQS